MNNVVIANFRDRLTEPVDPEEFAEALCIAFNRLAEDFQFRVMRAKVPGRNATAYFLQSLDLYGNHVEYLTLEKAFSGYLTIKAAVEFMRNKKAA